jgi:ankyrin repeat protein
MFDWMRKSIANKKLLTAVKEGKIDVVEDLLAKGADINSKTAEDWTPLEYAAMLGHEAIMKALIPRVTDISQRWIALRIAALEGHLGIVELLSPYSANLKMPETVVHPLWCAAYKGNVAIVQCLLEHGANCRC